MVKKGLDAPNLPAASVLFQPRSSYGDHFRMTRRAAGHGEHLRSFVIRQERCRAADTRFATDHSFDKIATIEDFRKSVPIADYDYFQPYVNRLVRGDVVRCRGYFGQAPLLEFLNKGQHISDLEGEKLSEHQLVQAVESARRELAVSLSQFIGVPVRPRNGLPHYALVVEETDLLDEQLAAGFLQLLDDRLITYNRGYERTRRAGFLDPPRLARVPRGTWNRLQIQAVRDRGTSPEQYKHCCLLVDPMLFDRLPNLVETQNQESCRSAA